MENLTNTIYSEVGFRTTTRIKTVFLLLSALLLWSATAQAQTTYYWRGTTGSSWNSGTNWNTIPAGGGTTRTTPLSTDVLVFDGAAQGAVFPVPIIVDYGNGSAPINQEISQLRIINKAAITLAGPTNANDGSILSISGGTASLNKDDFFVDALSSLKIIASGNTQNRFLLIKIGTGKKGLVTGKITFDASSQTYSRLVPADAGSLIFSGNNATFTAATVNGSPFGTTGANSLTTSNGSALPLAFTDVTVSGSVIFQPGTTYVQSDGLTPFSTGPSPVTVFKSTSRYSYNGGTFATVGQTYGYLEFAGGTAVSPTVNGTQQMVVLNDLTMTSGTANLNLTSPTTGTTTGTSTGTTAPVSIGGNLNANGGILNFSPTSGSTVAFNSPISPATAAVTQTINGIGTLNFNSPSIFEINNEAGLTLNRPITVNGGLRFTLGLLNTTTTNLLSLPSTVATNNISDGKGGDAKGLGGSFVNGPIARTTVPSTSSTLFFPVGGVGRSTTAAPTGMQNYRPMTLVTTNQTSSTTYTGVQMEMTAGGQTGVDAPLDHVSSVRYFQITPSVGGLITQPTGSPFNATVMLTFGTDDYVNKPDLPTFVIAKRNSPAFWTNISRSANSLSTLTSGIFTSFSDFSLASTEKSNGFPGTNPLPVELTRFTATAQANGISLGWATAQEKNNDRFEVQRSATGAAFETVGTVKGQGSSSSAHEYAFADNHPLAGLAYYRLRQVDFDGSSAFSPVTTVRWDQNRGLAYPNPNSGSVTLAPGLGAVAYRIFNALGQTVLQGQAAGNERLDLTRLPLGPYLLELTGQTGRSTQRLLRE